MVLFVLAACSGGTSDPGQCAEGDDPVIDVAQRADWNLPDGVVDFGIPPQGGSPYAPFEVRLVDAPFAEAYRIEMSATIDGETYDTPPYMERFVCANVGEQAGTRYTPDLHMRFFGSEPPELDARDVSMTFSAFIGGDLVAERTVEGTLDWTLGPMPL
jgi:hypothetical protein